MIKLSTTFKQKKDYRSEKNEEKVPSYSPARLLIYIMRDKLTY